jgi:hypothetical protein
MINEETKAQNNLDLLDDEAYHGFQTLIIHAANVTEWRSQRLWIQRSRKER